MASSDKTPITPSPGGPQGTIRWRRAALLLVPSLGAAVALVMLTASGVLASSISVSGSPFTVTASELDGTGFSQYGSSLSPAGHGTQPVSVSVIQHAQLHDLCQSVTAGPLTLQLTAGARAPVQASDLVVAADVLRGDATFRNIVIGQDAGQLPGGYPPPQSGGFGEQADSVTIRHLYQHTWLTTAGTFRLPGLSISFTSGRCGG
jgi:hypothetical protein